MRRENGYYDIENNAEQKDKLRKNRQGAPSGPPPLIYQCKTVTILDAKRKIESG